eukprot:3400613-Pleurochrysis_carterae.AAC.1
MLGHVCRYEAYDSKDIGFALVMQHRSYGLYPMPKTFSGSDYWPTHNTRAAAPILLLAPFFRAECTLWHLYHLQVPCSAPLSAFIVRQAPYSRALMSSQAA